MFEESSSESDWCRMGKKEITGVGDICKVVGNKRGGNKEKKTKILGEIRKWKKEYKRIKDARNINACTHEWAKQQM